MNPMLAMAIPAIIGWLQGQKLEKNQPKLQTTGSVTGFDPNKLVGKPTISQEGSKASGSFQLPQQSFTKFNPTGTTATYRPDLEQVGRAMAGDLSRAFDAATTERDRSLQAGQDFASATEDVRTSGLKTADMIADARTMGEAFFEPVSKQISGLVASSRTMKSEIMAHANKTLGTALAMYADTRRFSGDVLSKASMEVATFVDGMRAGIDRQTESHKIEVASRMSQQGATSEEISAAMSAIDYEKGATLLSAAGSIAEQQSQRLQDIYRDMGSLVANQGAQVASTALGVLGEVRAGLSESSRLQSTAVELSARMAEARASYESELVIAEANHRNLVDTLYSQNKQFLASFMSNIKEPVMLVAPFYTFMMDTIADLVGQDNAVEQANFATTAGIAQYYNDVVFGAMNMGFRAEELQLQQEAIDAQREAARWGFAGDIIGSGIGTFGAGGFTGGISPGRPAGR